MSSSAELTDWEVASAEPGGEPGDWRAETLPWHGSDDRDWWFRTRFTATQEAVLRFDGLATVCEVRIDGRLALSSSSMFRSHSADVPAGDHELVVVARALAPLLRERRRPRQRWRTNLVSEANLRFFRTTLLGRAPGFAPGPPVVGPWRPVRLDTPGSRPGVSWRPRLEGDDGVLAVTAEGADRVELDGPSGRFAADLSAEGRAELRVPDVKRWSPHTHGDPALHEVRVLAGGEEVARRRTGFRTLRFGGPDPAEEGLELWVNDVRVFARGAVWTPVPERELRAALEQARAAGMNLLRIPGTGAYESVAFHDLCDELGLLVWQDFMFANLDYPVEDPDFIAEVEAEAQAVLAEVAGRPSLAVLCGNSEVEQQVAMMGLDPALGRGPLFGEILPRLVHDAGVDAAYLPSSPCGGDLPFRPDRGVANYFGVGGYRRPLSDARLAGVRFAAECLAFANVGEEDVLPVHDPRWKAGVPRDAGTGWDFDDVRDHYLALRFDVDPQALRSVDHDRYLELSRAVTGEVMAEVLGEWRRAGSPCGGALVLWLRDLAPGAGWGVVDHRGTPKAAYHHLRRALAPVAVWTTDEGLGGVRVHVANDRPEPLAAQLRIALYRGGEHRVGEAAEPIELPAHGDAERDVEAMLGSFVDASYAYRFGPPAQDAIIAALTTPDGRPLSQAVRHPVGRRTTREPADRLGLEAEVDGDGLRIRSRGLVTGVRVRVPGFVPDDDAFFVEPGGERVVALRPVEPAASFTGGAVTALELDGRVVLR